MSACSAAIDMPGRGMPDERLRGASFG